MIDIPSITHSSAQHAAVIHLRVPRAKMFHVFRPAVEEVMAVLATQGITPSGAIFAHHLRLSPKILDFEVGFPVGTPVTATGCVRPGWLPAAKVARTIYHGRYEGLPAARDAFITWIKASGLTPSPDLWEYYFAGPHSNPDPATWRTELNQPVIG